MTTIRVYLSDRHRCTFEKPLIIVDVVDKLRRCDFEDGFRLYESSIAGVLLRPRYDLSIDAERDLCAYLIVRAITESAGGVIDGTLDNLEVAQAITSVFEEHLLFDAFEKKGWSTGKTTFTDQVNFYTSRGLPVEYALPAFPCKTTNPEKASSTLPDGAEYEALANLQSFCDRVRQIYSPGCYMNIVSDGHVFSDCQGTDDELVHTYNKHLKIMLESMCAKKHESTTTTTLVTTPAIRLYDLGQLLLPDSHARCLADKVSKADKVRHPVMTQISGIDDDNRALMLDLFAPPEQYYRDLIKCQPDHPITALYRGFSRFMFEDLVLGSSPETTSKKQRKHAAEEVAMTMIQRNQTYSRMVESVMPRHVRLSIHAHDNAGPKFAVRVTPGHVRHAQSADELVNAGNVGQEDAWDARGTGHIPTPWHNTLVEVETQDGPQMFLCRQSVVKEALKRGFEGGYVEHERGARYVIRKA